MGDKWEIDNDGKLIREDETDLEGQIVRRFFYEMATDNTWFGSTTQSWTTRPNEYWVHNLSALQGLDLDLPQTELEVRLFAQFYVAQSGSEGGLRLYNVTDGVVVVDLSYTAGTTTAEQRHSRRVISDPITIDLSKTYRIEYRRVGGTGVNAVNIARAGLLFINRMV